MENMAFQPSKNLGRSVGSSPYLRKRESRHSRAPNSIPFTVDGCTSRHDPVFVTPCKRRATWTGSTTRVSASASSDLLFFTLPHLFSPLHVKCGVDSSPEILLSPEC